MNQSPPGSGRRPTRLTVWLGLAMGIAAGLVSVSYRNWWLRLGQPWWLDRFDPWDKDLPILVATSLVLFLACWIRSFRARWPRLRDFAYQCSIVLGMTWLVWLGFSLFHGALYEPGKYRYLTWRVESAKTAHEEKAAFEWANRWGYVNQLRRRSTEEELPERAKHLQGPWILEVIWLECSFWTRHPYRAYRVLIDERNLAIFDKPGLAVPALLTSSNAVGRTR
jgi:hypothetical protein